MIFGIGRRRRPTRQQLEDEAADVIAALVASGRPPPEVWRKAEEWRAAHPMSDDAWYKPEPTPPLPSTMLAGTSAVALGVVQIADLPTRTTRPTPLPRPEPVARISTN